MAILDTPLIYKESYRSLLESCVTGNERSVHCLLKLLGHPSLELRQAFQYSIRQINELKLWRGLLSYLAVRRWETGENISQPIQLHPDPEHQMRIDESILELLEQDISPGEAPQKIAAVRLCIWSDSVQQRFIVSFILVSRGERSAIATLTDLFPHVALEWQIRAIRLLGRQDNPDGGQILIAALCSNNKMLHHEAHRDLTRLGINAFPAWLAALQHPDSHIRWHAARGIGELGDTRAVEILVTGLLDENAAVRWATSTLLARMGKKVVKTILQEISRKPLDEPTRQVCYHALNGMTGHDLHAHLAPIIEALHGPGSDLLASSTAQKILAGWAEHFKPDV